MPKKKVHKDKSDDVSPHSPRRSKRVAAKTGNSQQQNKSFLKNKENFKLTSKQSQKSTSLKKNKVESSKSNILAKNSTKVTNIIPNIKKRYNLRNKTDIECKQIDERIPTKVTRDRRILKNDSLTLIKNLDLGNNNRKRNNKNCEYVFQKPDNEVSTILLTGKGNRRILKKNDSLNHMKEFGLENNNKGLFKNSNNHSQVSLNSAQNSSKAYTRHLLNKSDSFEEYGMLLPSYEQILGNINKMKNEAKALDTYEELYEDLDITLPNGLRELINGTLTPQKLELLDCKHLSREQINNYFHKNLDHIKNIFKGVTYSERHERYKNYDAKFDFTYCTSTVIYTEEQKDHLLMLLEENFDPEEKQTQYLFQVLLPELCLKIFMDVHNKSNEEAIKYLEWRPVE